MLLAINTRLCHDVRRTSYRLSSGAKEMLRSADSESERAAFARPRAVPSVTGWLRCGPGSPLDVPNSPVLKRPRNPDARGPRTHLPSGPCCLLEVIQAFKWISQTDTLMEHFRQ